jgi:hypothetical protein
MVGQDTFISNEPVLVGHRALANQTRRHPGGKKFELSSGATSFGSFFGFRRRGSAVTWGSPEHPDSPG